MVTATGGLATCAGLAWRSPAQLTSQSTVTTLLMGKGPQSFLTGSFVFSPFQLLFGFIYSSIQNQKPMPWSSFQSSSKLMSLHSQNHKTTCWNSWMECKLPRKYPLALRWHSGAFSPGQCDWGLPRSLAIFCGKHLCFHHWLLLCCSLRPWAPSTYDSSW